MKNLMNIFDRVNDALAYLAGVLFVFMMFTIGIEIMLRFFIGYAFGWVVQFSGYSLLYMTFLGAAWLLKRNGHVAIDIVFNLLDPKAQLYTNVVTSIFGVILCVVVTWYGVETTWETFQRGVFTVGILKWPEWVIIGIIPVGSFLLSIQFIRITYGYLKQGTKRGR